MANACDSIMCQCLEDKQLVMPTPIAKSGAAEGCSPSSSLILAVALACIEVTGKGFRQLHCHEAISRMPDCPNPNPYPIVDEFSVCT